MVTAAREDGGIAEGINKKTNPPHYVGVFI
jgi:hypothetical protein